MKKEDIREACDRFRPGLYTHTKTGNLYRALLLVAHHETRDPWVVYFSLARGSLNIRPLKATANDPDGWDEMVAVEQSPDGVTHTMVPRFRFKDSHIDGVSPRENPEHRMLVTLLTLVRGIGPVGDLLAELERRQGDVPSADFGSAADTVEKRAKLLLDTITGKIPSEDVTDQEL